MPRILPLLVSVVCLGAVLPLAAQCEPAWTAGAPQAELSGAGRTLTFWDPDGVGPLPLQLVVAGNSLVGGTAANAKVMTFDGTAWQVLGPGPGTSGAVTCLTVWNGLLVAGGFFQDGIAAWNGAAWLPLGPGLPFAVTALTVWNGNLIAAGSVSGLSGCSVRSWDGATWTNLPSPPWLQWPRAAVSYQGQLCLAGDVSIGGGQVGYLERWNGSVWAPSITTNGVSSIYCMAVRPALQIGGVDRLFVGGSFTTLGGTAVSRIATTTGGSAFAWSSLGAGLAGTCVNLVALSAGLSNFSLVAVVGNGGPAPVMQYSGSASSGTWTTMGTATLTAVTSRSGTFYAASEFAGAAASLAWNGTAWEPVRGNGFVGEVRALAPRGAQTIVGGVFPTVGGTTTNHIAAWDGTTFTTLGGGMTGTSVDALLRLDDGDVVAGGAFTAAGGIAASNLARWNGSAWASLGAGTNQPVLALCKLPNGDIVVGGSFTTAGGVPCARIARWNGSAWAPLGSGMNGDVRALAVRGDGVLFAGGTFTNAGGQACARIAQWNGTSWLPLGAGCNDVVHGLAVRPNGDVVAVGAFSSAGGFGADRCARWFGVGWSPMGSDSGDPTPARAVHVLPNGDVVVGRGFHQPNTATDTGLSRWNGTTWSGLAGGLGPHQNPAHVDVRAFAAQDDGDLVVGGDFSSAGGFAARRLAVLSPTCPAVAQSYGAGCSSAAGPLVLVAETLPWLGGVLHTRTTGIAGNSICVGAIGFQQLATPMVLLHPAGQPGCTLLTSLDILLLLVPTTGTARASFALANNASLLGFPFCQQTIPLELDAGGAFVAIRGSNALSLTIGTF